MKRKILLILVLITFTKILYSQTSIDTDFRKKANEYYVNSDWDNAIKMYSQIVAAEDKNLQAWNRLATSYLNKKDYDKAFEILNLQQQKATIMLCFIIYRVFMLKRI